MATIRYTTAAVAFALALVSRASTAQSASTSLTHTVVVTVPPRVKVQVAPTLNRQQPSGLKVNVTATRAYALVVGSKKGTVTTARLVANSGSHSSSMVLNRSQTSQRSPETGGASDSEPVMLTVVAQ